MKSACIVASAAKDIAAEHILRFSDTYDEI